MKREQSRESYGVNQAKDKDIERLKARMNQLEQMVTWYHEKVE